MLRMLKDRLNIPGRSGSRREDRENLEDLLRRTGSPAHPRGCSGRPRSLSRSVTSPRTPSSPGSPRRAGCPVRRPRRSCQSRAETRGMSGGPSGCPGPGESALLRRPGRLRSRNGVESPAMPRRPRPPAPLPGPTALTGPTGPAGAVAMTASPLRLRLYLRLPASVLRLQRPQRLQPPVLAIELRAEAAPSSRWLRPHRPHRPHRQHQRRIGAKAGHIQPSIQPSIQLSIRPSTRPNSAPTRVSTCAPLPPSAMPMTSCAVWRSSCAVPGRRSSTPS